MTMNLFAVFMVMKYGIWGGNALSGNVLNVVNTNIRIIYMGNLEKECKHVWIKVLVLNSSKEYYKCKQCGTIKYY